MTRLERLNEGLRDRTESCADRDSATGSIAAVNMNWAKGPCTFVLGPIDTVRFCMRCPR